MKKEKKRKEEEETKMVKNLPKIYKIESSLFFLCQEIIFKKKEKNKLQRSISKNTQRKKERKGGLVGIDM